MNKVVVVLMGLDQELRDPVIVILACWLDVSIVEVKPEVEDVLERLNPEDLPGCTRDSLCSTRLEFDPVDRNTHSPNAGSGTRVDRFGGESVADILFGNGVGVSVVGKVAGLVIGQRVAVDGPSRPVDDSCHQRAKLFIQQGVGAQIF